MSKPDASDLIRGRASSAFENWSLPSFDPEVEVLEPEPVVEVLEAEEVPLEEVKPLTLEELEAIQQEAYNEGFSAGEKDGFHAGQLRARQEAEQVLARRLEDLDRLMSHLLEPIAQQDQQMEQALVRLVGQVARQVIRRELSMDSSQLGGILRDALKLLPMGAGNIRIHVNPQDFELVKALKERHEESWKILEDDSLLPGGCRIETEHSLIDASNETRLEQALQQLFEQQRQQATQPAEADLHEDFGGSDAVEEPRDEA